MEKFLESIFDEPKWREIFRPIIENCLKEIESKFPEIQKKFEAAPYNVKKEQCNVKHMVINSCVFMDAIFTVKFSMHPKVLFNINN